jgi:predicted acylesterase/phospholipase RssA
VPLELALHSASRFFSFLNVTITDRGAFWKSLDLDAILFDTEPLARLIRENVDIERLRKSGKELSIAVTCLGRTRGNALVRFDERTVTHAHIHASCALPLIFPVVMIDNCAYCDGGVVMNTPLKLALERDPTDIFIIYLAPPPRKFVDATLPLAYQAMSDSFAASTRADLEVAENRTAEYLAAFREDRLVNGRLAVSRDFGTGPVAKEFSYVRIFEINPRDDMEGLEGFLEFAPDFARKLIARGEEDTERILREDYFEEVISSNSGRKMKVLRRRKRV